jgi:DNA polymerase
MELAIDIETYSENDIKWGVHKYAECPKFEILLFAYSINAGPVQIIDLAMGEKIPGEIYNLLTDDTCTKTAYNAAFEMTCLQAYLKIQLDPSQWSCTQALAAQAGWPFGLGNVAKAMGNAVQKDTKGKELIKFFTMPCTPSKSNNMRRRNRPIDDFDKWASFKAYCIQDVETELGIRAQLSWFTVPEFEKEVWALDQTINNRGVKVDLELVKNAVEMDKIVADKLVEEMFELTQISNPKSNAQVKKFIMDATGEDVKSLNKGAMAEVNTMFKDTEIEHVLKIREKLSRTSIKKFTAILNSACNDGSVKGLFQYYGANRTGRWAGRNVQLQNLKRNDLKELDLARQLVKENNLQVLELLFDDVGYVLSNLIRTAFVASPGNSLIVSDLSAIEARIIAWLAGEKWRLDVFATHGKIYEASASVMFKIPLEDITKELRQKGKIAELALGYQGAVGALERMGGAAMGLSSDEMTRLVKQWRNGNKKIVDLWTSVNDCAIEAIMYGSSKMDKLNFTFKNKNLIIELPSGRNLVYISATYNGKAITYKGMDQTTKQWSTQDTYGGKLVENIVQAIARDVLTEALKRLKNYNIVMHVHDEIVIDGNIDEKLMTDAMRSPMPWAPDLHLGAETFTAQYYQK